MRGILVVVVSLLAWGIAAGAWGQAKMPPSNPFETIRVAELREDMSATDPRWNEPEWNIVSFVRAPDRDERSELTTPSYGFTLHDYLGNGRYLEYLTRRQVAKFVAWSDSLRTSGNPPLYGGHARLDERARAEIGEQFVASLKGLPSGDGLYRVRTLSPPAALGMDRVERVLDALPSRMESQIVVGVERRERRESDPGAKALWKASRGHAVRSACSTSVGTLTTCHGEVVDIVDSWFVDRDHPELGKSISGITDDAPDLPPLPHAHATFAAGIVKQNAEAVLLHSTRLTNEANLLGALEHSSSVDVQGSHAARVHVASWHYALSDGSTAHAVDSFAWKNEDELFIASAGDGRNLGSPASAKNGLAVAAAGCTEKGTLAHGAGNLDWMLTSGARRKPDIHAPGCGTRSIKGGETEPDDGWDLFASYCATSWAAPAAAAMAAQVRAYYAKEYRGPLGLPISPSGALLKASLINVSTRVDRDSAETHSREAERWISWGQPALATIGSRHERGTFIVKDLRHANGIETGEIDRFRVHADSDSSVCVTLAWSDAPAVIAAANARVVNDLNLRVLEVTGAAAARDSEQSGTCDSLGPDSTNNVEQLSVKLAAGNDYVIEVGATNQWVTRGRTLGQGYALVVSSAGRLTDGPAERDRGAKGVQPLDRSLLATSIEPGAKSRVPAENPPEVTWERRIKLGEKGTRFDNYWGEMEVAGGSGLQDGGETSAIWSANGEFRYSRFRELTVEESKGMMGFGGTRVVRRDEFAVGAAGRDEDWGDSPTLRPDGEFAWAYYDHSLPRRSVSTKRAWGILADIASVDRARGEDVTVTQVTPGMSFSFDSPGDCERNRLALHATYADVEDGHDFAVGATFSVHREEDGDLFDARCAQASVFRRMYLDDHRNYHVSFEHREHSGSNEPNDADGSIDYLAFEGQVPLLRHEPEHRHITFDWFAGMASVRRDAMASGMSSTHDWLGHVDVGVNYPLGSLKVRDGYTRREFGVRLGVGGRWYDSDVPGLDQTDFVVSLMLHAVLGAGGDTDDRAVRWSDVPSSGSTTNPGSGEGPGSITVPNPP